MILIKLLSWIQGGYVGADEFGNRYYRRARAQRPERRWVLYKGLAEASKIPPDWHHWLHYTSEQPPSHTPLYRHHWQKNFTPNLTGTSYAYRPIKAKKGNFLNYEPWRPL